MLQNILKLFFFSNMNKNFYREVHLKLHAVWWEVLDFHTFQLGMFAKCSYYFNQFKFARPMILTEAIGTSCDPGS